MAGSSAGDGPYEWERRFLVSEAEGLPFALTSMHIRQAYLWAQDGYAIRVRITCRSPNPADISRATLALKGPRVEATRYEVEAEVDPSHAIRIYAGARYKIVKVRDSVEHAGDLWEIDRFEGLNYGLTIAEYEASQAAVQGIAIPAWVGQEVTNDSRYDNERLAMEPWQIWNTAV